MIRYTLHNIKLFHNGRFANTTKLVYKNNLYNECKVFIYKCSFHFEIILKNKDNSLTPYIEYKNINIEKASILKNNKGKTGVYCWTNLINSKTYVGSANDLRTRFWVYFNINRLMCSNMPIYKAIIKHGYANFKLEILEYCDPKILLLREQYYIDLLKSDYNVLNTTGSTFGYKHTEATLTKFNLRKVSSNTRANLAKAALARVLSEETKINISVAKIGVKLSEETKAKLSDVGAKIRGVSVEIVNTITGEIKQYLTLTSAGLALGVSRTAIKKAIISGKIIKKTYIVKLMSRK